MTDAPAHPAPHRTRTTPGAAAFAVLGAPLAWGLQQIVAYAVVGAACAAGRAPEALDQARQAAVGFNVVGVAAALAATLAALRIWRATHRESAGDEHALLDVGEGRTRFLAMWGVAGGVLFTAAAVANTLALALAPVCAT